MLHTKDAVFRESYVAAHIPFHVYKWEDNLSKAMHQQYSPYVHWQKAFEQFVGENVRLSNKDR